MERKRKIVILGRIGETEFQNNDCCKVLFRGGCSKCVKTVTNYSPMVIRKWKRKS